MARNYEAEYRARELRAKRSGFGKYPKAYAEERRQREQADQQREAESAARSQGWQGPFTSVQTDDDWEQITPTRSSYSEGPNKSQQELRNRPSHRRTIAARYNKGTGRMEVMFSGNGGSGDAPYHFNDIPPTVWNQFKRHWSPGRYLYYYIEPQFGKNEVLNPKTGAVRLRGWPGGFDSIEGEDEENQ
jgi:hypothetical protein